MASAAQPARILSMDLSMIEKIQALLARIIAWVGRKKVENIAKSGPVDVEELFTNIPVVTDADAPPIDEDGDEMDSFEKGFN